MAESMTLARCSGMLLFVRDLAVISFLTMVEVDFIFSSVDLELLIAKFTLPT